MKEPIVKFEKINKSFGDLHVLHDLDFHAQRGERVAIIGQSGSGKTTLLRLLMTLEKPDSGLIFVDGEPLWHKVVDGKYVKADQKHLRQIRGKIGMVFQHFNLFPHMQVLRNVTEAPIHVNGMDPKEAKEQALELLDMVGLNDKTESYPSELSGGQKQRVAIARALAMKPEIMLFDEVTGALDPELVGEVLNVIRRLADVDHMTMLLVTHEMDFAREIAHRVLFFDDGCIEEEGPPDMIFSHPTNERTQTFLKRILER